MMISWRILNRLFGWHYVAIRSSAMGYRHTRRLRATKSGILYVEFPGGCNWFLLDDGKVDNGYSWVALTF